MLLDESISIRWTKRNKKWYIKKGYIFTEYGDAFEANINELTDGCRAIVQVLCDYCEKNVSLKAYGDYATQHKKANLNKDCCYECRPLKIKESNLLKYGVESTNQIQEIRQKQKDTCIKRYGGENCMVSRLIREKVQQTVLERYGTKAPAQNKEIKEKIMKTNLEKYGHVSPTLHPKVRMKQINTTLRKYNVKYPMQNKEILNKAKETLSMNGNGPCSRQQLQIKNVVGGKINYAVGNYLLDVAFPGIKLYIECDFGGHWLQVKFGRLTIEEFSNKAKRRWYYLYKKSGKVSP
ncbi:hypothetical protein [Brevibacillus brevis]|uniref:DUF7487 domain-containing protein n=1 Tax=Brevibacillus brevis TaxID=1393 RepID=A0ABY9T4C6_BREBE|nr:hypothetical protein [Brevibacillus brevis]WNC14876.1 hypothetical protein RGB73_00295 [Brevibacillus brevis]